MTVLSRIDSKSEGISDDISEFQSQNDNQTLSDNSFELVSNQKLNFRSTVQKLGYGQAIMQDYPLGTSSADYRAENEANTINKGVGDVNEQSAGSSPVTAVIQLVDTIPNVYKLDIVFEFPKGKITHEDFMAKVLDFDKYLDVDAIYLGKNVNLMSKAIRAIGDQHYYYQQTTPYWPFVPTKQYVNCMTTSDLPNQTMLEWKTVEQNSAQANFADFLALGEGVAYEATKGFWQLDTSGKTSDRVTYHLEVNPGKAMPKAVVDKFNSAMKVFPTALLQKYWGIGPEYLVS